MLRHGIDEVLEEEATRLIMESLKGVTRFIEKADILTPWKEVDRRSREVYVNTGTPDPIFNRGMFHRAANPRSPHLNANDGVMKGRRNKEGQIYAGADESIERTRREESPRFL
jgi:hypothetical protein